MIPVYVFGQNTKVDINNNIDKKTQKEVVEWLTNNSRTLLAPDEMTNFSDLQFLHTIIENIKVVGVGEGTHGTQDFNQFRNRIIAFLITEMDYTHVALESSFVGTQTANDYIFGKTNDRQQAIKDLKFKSLINKSTEELLDWLKAHNQTVIADKKVQFIGVDIQYNLDGQAKIHEYLKRVAPEYVAEFDEVLKVDIQTVSRSRFGESDSEKVEEIQKKLMELRGAFNNIYTLLSLREHRFVLDSSQKKYDEIFNYAKHVVQFLDAYVIEDSNGWITASSRDYFMADNIKSISKKHPKAKIIFSGHNAHVIKSNENKYGEFTRAGFWLKKFYGDAYYVITTSFNQGGVMSHQRDSISGEMVLKNFILDEAPKNTMAWYLNQTHKDRIFIDFRDAKKNNSVNLWGEQAILLRDIGYSYDPKKPEDYFEKVKVMHDFDALVFFENTSGAIPIEFDE